MTDVLKPCPFCGGAADLVPDRLNPTSDDHVYVMCNHCDVYAPYGKDETRAGQTERWNRRASPPVVCGNCGGTGAGSADTNGKTEPCPYCRPRGGQ